MLVVRLVGGLANKMFQYALYKSLLNAGMDVYIDNFSWKPKWDFEHINLEKVFTNVEFRVIDIENNRKLGGGQDLFSKLRRKVHLFANKHYIKNIDFKYNPSLFDLKGNYYLEGLWQTEKYFINIKNKIMHDFMFAEFTNKNNLSLAIKLDSEQSIAIHVRKGTDYIRQNTFGTCSLNYYQKAIKYMNQNVLNPIYYVFTDNQQWVDENFKEFQYKVIDWNPISGPDNYLDMQLMSVCKHNIIANSSYSWWAAWLNRNPNKIVIGPKKWFNTEYQKLDTSDLLPDDWIKL